MTSSFSAAGRPASTVPRRWLRGGCASRSSSGNWSAASALTGLVFRRSREPELAGQTVIVIGGSAGIGLETARRTRAEGADVILTGRNPDRLKRAALEIGWKRER
jgi:NADPH:quinone reductase-like Zn-dependent oxidoreductase